MTFPSAPLTLRSGWAQRVAAGVVAVSTLALSSCSLIGGTQQGAEGTPSVAVTTPQQPTEESSSSEPSDEATSSEPTDEATSAEPSDEASSSEPTSSQPTGTFKQTAPGTKLKFGQEAMVTYGTSEERRGNIIIKPTSITKGSFADLAKIKNSEKYKDYTPYYIKVTVTAADDSAAKLKYSGPGVVMKPFTPKVTGLGTLTIIGRFDKCENESFEGSPKAGDSYETCIIAMAKAGESAAGIAYAPAGGAYSSINGKPIFWTVA
ncbi:hypothetical protein ACSDQ9_03655 [Aestuariimicrobium soli]|uniref:hypothetical protein n=1 Tax=Aestuariimicrobium soli TaxID=2035834 RepID=UPI003EBE9971